MISETKSQFFQIKRYFLQFLKDNENYGFLYLVIPRQFILFGSGFTIIPTKISGAVLGNLEHFLVTTACSFYLIWRRFNWIHVRWSSWPYQPLSFAFIQILPNQKTLWRNIVVFTNMFQLSFILVERLGNYFYDFWELEICLADIS